MSETPPIPSNDEAALLEYCAFIYEREGADWMPIATLRRLLLEEDFEPTQINKVAHILREHNQSLQEREYDNKRARGYTKRQFREVVKVYSDHETEAGQEEHGHDLNVCAEQLIEFVSSLDPDWPMLIEVLRHERGFDAKTAIASLMAYVLQHRLHMVVPGLEAFRPSEATWTPETKICSVCGEEYRMTYAGQPPVCLKSACGRTYHAKEVPAEEEPVHAG